MREISVSPGAVSHPDLDRWVAYHGGDLPESEEDQLRSHLAECKTCVSTVLELDAFSSFDPPDDAIEVSEFDMAAAWRAMKAELAVQQPATRQSGRSTRSNVFANLALASSLIFGIVGWALWSTEHRTVNQLRKPQLNLAIRDLEANRTTRSGGEPSPTEIQEHEFTALVMLPSQSFAAYEVLILDMQGRTVWTSAGLLPDPELGTLTLGLPPGALEPGNFHLRLRGGKEKIPLAEELSIKVRP